jgi:hypothetical protein
MGVPVGPVVELIAHDVAKRCGPTALRTCVQSNSTFWHGGVQFTTSTTGSDIRTARGGSPIYFGSAEEGERRFASCIMRTDCFVQETPLQHGGARAHEFKREVLPYLADRPLRARAQEVDEASDFGVLRGPTPQNAPQPFP